MEKIQDNDSKDPYSERLGNISMHWISATIKLINADSLSSCVSSTSTC